MSIATQISALQADKTAIATAITNKGGTVASGDGFDDFATDIGTISGKTTASWNQCPTLVRNYLANVTYDPSDYSTSQIADYAPATAVSSNTKPIGYTIDSVTYYNEVPNETTPFSSTHASGTVEPLDNLRWINSVTENMRDIGGWTCDGGTTKYGMLFRGGEPSASDKALAVDTLGIRHELQLRGSSEAPRAYSLWDIPFTCPTDYAWYSISNKTVWKEILRCVFDTVNKNVPLYFHCAAGADRTGTVACMLEALLGMSQSDIDKDYELASFATGTSTATTTRARNESEWTGLITAIKSVTLAGGLTDSFRNRAVSFVLSLGFTIDEINAFRTAMIDGTPDTITVSLDNYTVTKSGTNITFDNSASSVTEFQEYEVNLTPDSGYAIESVTITMGGIDVTALYLSGTETNINRSISNTYSNCSSSNAKTWCINGQSYVEDITANTDYEFTSGNVTVTMGGTDITSSTVLLLE